MNENSLLFCYVIQLFGNKKAFVSQQDICLVALSPRAIRSAFTVENNGTAVKERIYILISVVMTVFSGVFRSNKLQVALQISKPKI